MDTFRYLTGESVRAGDLVQIIEKRTIIDRVFSKGAKDSREFSCEHTGGILLKFEDGDLQLWCHTNEDLKLIKSAPETLC